MSLITIISGKLDTLFVIYIIRSYLNTKNKLISTWKDQCPTLINLLQQHGYIIVLSDPPVHMTSYNAQAACSLAGIKKAVELGFTHVCRSRTDIFPLNHEYFLKCTEDLYQEKILAISGVNTYIMDVFLVGPIEQILKAYSSPLQAPGDLRCPEGIILESIFGKPNQSKEEIKEKVNFALTRCQENGLEIVWHRPPRWKNAIRSIPFMKIVNEYCKDDFIWV